MLYQRINIQPVSYLLYLLQCLVIIDFIVNMVSLKTDKMLFSVILFLNLFCYILILLKIHV